MAFSKIIARLFFIILIIGFIAITLKQGKDGGELVYKYGANSKALTSLKEKLDELEEEQKESEDTQAKIKELQEKYDTLLRSSKATEEKVEEMVVTEDESKADTSSKVEVEKEESNSSVVSLEIPSDSNKSH